MVYCCSIVGYTFGSSDLLVFLICRVGRVTECGGEVGRLNVIGGVEVALCLFTHPKVFHLIYAVGSKKKKRFLYY